MWPLGRVATHGGHPQGLARAGNPWTVQVDWPLAPAVWSALALGGAQSVHVTNTGTRGASSGLHCHIL